MSQSLWGSWILVGVGALSTGVANILLKQSRLVAAEPRLFAGIYYFWFIGALVFYCIDLLLFAKALDRLPVSIAQPVSSGIMFSCVVIFSNVFLGEALKIGRVVGLGLIFAGIIVMSQK